VSRDAATVLLNMMLLAVALIMAIGTASAGGAAPAVNDREIMLYVNQPLWSRAGALRMYGFRMDRLRAIDSTSIQRTTLIDFQLRAHSDFRVEVGRRVTWNIGRSEFGPQAGSSYLPMPLRDLKLAEPPGQPPADPTSFRTNRAALGLGHAIEDGFIHSHSPLTASWSGCDSCALQQPTIQLKILSFGSVRFPRAPAPTSASSGAAQRP
jgi:hypothetical protein